MGKGTATCFGRTEGRHMCPVAAMETYRECCRCSTHSTPLCRFRDGRPLTPKSFFSTLLALVDQCGYDPAPSVYLLIQPQQPPEPAFPLTPFRSLEDGESSSPDPPIRHQNYGYTVTITQLYLSMPCTLVPYSS